MDDRGGACLLHRLAAGLRVQATGLGTTTPHAAILVLSRVASAAVGATHRAVVQRH